MQRQEPDEVLQGGPRRDLHDGTSIQVPALLYGGKTIWGLTYRMLCGFLELIA